MDKITIVILAGLAIIYILVIFYILISYHAVSSNKEKLTMLSSKLDIIKHNLPRYNITDDDPDDLQSTSVILRTDHTGMS